MWELVHKEGWAPKNWCFGPTVLKKTLENPLDFKEIKPVNPKGNQYSLEGLMLKLKLQHFSHLMWRADSLEKTLMLGKIEGRRRRGQQRIRWLDGITDSMNVSLSTPPGDADGLGSLVGFSPWGHRVGHNLTTDQQLTWLCLHLYVCWSMYKVSSWSSLKSCATFPPLWLRLETLGASLTSSLS